MVVKKTEIKPKILGELFDLLLLVILFIFLCFVDDKYAAEVKEYNSQVSNGVLEKVNTTSSPAEYSDKSDKSK